MRFRAEMRELKKLVEQFTLEEENSAKLIAILQKEIDALRSQNELLFDRLMSKNFEEFAHLKTEPDMIIGRSGEVTFNEDEGHIGEIVDETE